MRRTGRWRWLAGAMALLFPAAVACHAYRPVATGRPDPGRSVRVQLADSAARARAGWHAVRSDALTGTVVAHAADSLLLSTPSRLGGGGASSAFRDTIAVPAALIRSVEQERLSVWRSALLTTGLVAGTMLVIELDLVGGGGSAPGGGQQPMESLWPW